MKLSECVAALAEEDRAALHIIRDGQIATLGFLSDPRHDVLSLLFDPRYLDELLANPNITAVVATAALSGQVPANRGLLLSVDPLQTFLKLHLALAARGFYWEHFDTTIAQDAQIHPAAHIAPQDVRIGRRTRIEAGAVIHPQSLIGEDCVIRANAVIGTEGFEPRDLDGRRINVPHTGGVRMANRVEIQAGAAVCRGLYGGFTEIGADTKIDNLVHIAHNVRIGERCRIVAGSAIGGSTSIGDDVWIGINATVSNSLKIGARARISLGAVVTRDVPQDGHVSGNFAIDHDKLIAFLRTVR